MYRMEDGVTGPQLCELCGRDKSDVSRTIAILQEKGFVTIQTCSAAARPCFVSFSKPR